MYTQTQWFDRVTEFEDRYREVNNTDGSITHVPVEGEIIQVGTPQNQTNFNNMENGIQDVHIAAALLAFWQHQQETGPDSADDASIAQLIFAFGNYHHARQVDEEIEGELKTVILTNSQDQPFNSTMDTPVSVALATARKNLFYSVETEVLEHSGLVGDIQVRDKALNGFKLLFTGSGSSVKLAVRVKGGMMQT